MIIIKTLKYKKEFKLSNEQEEIIYSICDEFERLHLFDINKEE